MDKVTLLIDGDVVAYKATAAVEQEIDWGDDLHTLHSEPEEAKRIVEHQIDSWMERLDATDAVVAFSDKTNFRHSIYPAYKADRSNKRKPLAYAEVKEWMMKKWVSYVRPQLEGDDVLGILATHPKLISGQKIIVSVDKDFKTIPGYFWNAEKDTQPRFYSEHDANFWHMHQTLTGDATDGYPGCPGVGPVKATKVLEETGIDHQKSWWEAVVEAYEKAGLTEEDALVQARCARILRHTDYDFKKKEVKLWRSMTLAAAVRAA